MNVDMSQVRPLADALRREAVLAGKRAYLEGLPPPMSAPNSADIAGAWLDEALCGWYDAQALAGDER